MHRDWEAAFAQMTYGIYVLTTKYQDTINGMIASWVSQVSYDPPLIMVAVHPNRYSHKLIEKSRAFALHVLLKPQKEHLNRFKGQDTSAKFSKLQWKYGKTGSPVLKECAAYFECNVLSAYQPGNHTLYIAKVIDAHILSNQKTLSTHDYEGVYLGKH